VKLGGTMATVGFPDIGLQGFAPKLAKGGNRGAVGRGFRQPSPILWVAQVANQPRHVV